MLKFPRWFQLLGLGALITLTQIIFMILNGPSGASLTERYLRLNQWDSLQYRIIAEEGYRIPKDRPHAITSEDIHSYRANVVFFPGLPMMARGLSKLTSVPISYALLLTSQFCAWGFWVFWLLIGAQLAIPLGIYAVFTLCVFLYPSTFFLVAGYTESPFLAGLLAFTFSLLYWRKKPSFTIGPALFSILAAIGMSFIRIVSFAASPLPFLLSITNRPLQEVWPLSSGKFKFLLIRNWRALLLGLFCTTGAVVFFSWSHFQFGQWNLYFKLEEIGWHNYKHWWALLDPRSYIPHFFFENTMDSISRASVPLTVALFVTAFIFEKKLARSRKQPAWWGRVPFYFTAFILFYIPLTGKANANMDSMIRYTLPPFIFLLLALADLARDRFNRYSDFRKWVISWPRKRKFAVVVALTFSLALQLWMSFKFLKGSWVA